VRNPTVILAAMCTAAPFVAGCAASPATSATDLADAARAAPQATGSLTITGSVGYRERISLTPDSIVVVELRDAALPPEAGAAAVKRIPLQGRQVPVPFSLEVDRSKLQPGHAYALRGGIIAGSRARWASDPVPIDATAAALDVGLLNLRAVTETPFGEASVLRARGNEPGWLLEIHPDQLTLTLQEAQARSAHGAPVASHIDGGTRYVAGAVTVRAFDRLCTDTMTGMPYPLTVEVARAADAPLLRGCGGEPAALLQQGEWHVRNVDGVDVTPGMQGTITFGADGSVGGRSFCNRYAGAYRLTGEGLTITDAASTMMACVGPAMELEGKMMAVLSKVARFEMMPDGGLVLHASDGGRVTAARAGAH
jgi:heat shock protein HslJ/uncharacterized lipoprotein YbaY